MKAFVFSSCKEFLRILNMNKIYKTVWNAVRRCLVVVNEATKGHSQATGGGGVISTAVAVGLSISFSGIAYAAYTVVDADDIDADNGAIQITPRNEEGYLFNANGNASNITQTGGFYSVLKTQNVFNQNDTIKIFIKNDSTGFSVSDGGKVFMGAWDEDNLNNAKIHNLQLENQTGGKTINWTFEANYDHEDDAGASDNGDNGSNLGKKDPYNWKGHTLVGATGNVAIDLKDGQLTLAKNKNDTGQGGYLAVLSRFGYVTIKALGTKGSESSPYSINIDNTDASIQAYHYIDIDADRYLQKGTVALHGLPNPNDYTGSKNQEHYIDIFGKDSLEVDSGSILVGNYALHSNFESGFKGKINLSSDKQIKFTNLAHVGQKHNDPGANTTDNEDRTTQLTLTAPDIDFLSGSGGEAQNITVLGNKTLEISGSSGKVHSHLIGSNSLDINSTDQVDLSDNAWIDGKITTIKTPTLSLNSNAHIGEATGKYQDAVTNITVTDLTLDNNSFINSLGSVNIKPTDEGNLSIKMDQAEGTDKDSESWIKGHSVEVGSKNASTNVTGGKLESTGAADSSVTVQGSSAVNLDDILLSGGAAGSVNVIVGNEGQINIGSSNFGETDSEINKDTVITGGNITIGSEDGHTNANIFVTDAQIGFPGSSSGGTININAGQGSNTIIGSEVGAADGHPVANGTVNIGGSEVVVGSLEDSDGETYDSVIGGSSINIGNVDSGKVTIGDALIGSESSSVKVEVGSTEDESGQKQPGQITIGNFDGSVDSTIQGGNIQIGSADESEADINISGSRDEDTGNSSTQIAGGNITIGNGSGNIDIIDSDISASNSDEDNKAGISINNGTDGEAGSISGSNIVADGNINLDGNINISGESQIEAGHGANTPIQDPNSGSVNFGTNSSGNIVIGGDSTIKGSNSSVGSGTNVSLGAEDGNGYIEIADGGTMGVDGTLNVEFGSSITSEGDMTVNVGTTSGSQGELNINQGGSVVAGVDSNGKPTANGGDLTIGGSGTVNVDGGKLQANAGSEADSAAGNINITGDVSMGNNGQIVADGVVTVGGETGNISTKPGQTGTIIASGENEDGDNLVINNGGSLTAGNGDDQGTLIIAKDEESADKAQSSGSTGLVMGDDANMSVGDGGHLVADDITFGEGSGIEMNGGNLYTDVDTILDNVTADGTGNITFDKDTAGNGNLQLSGTINQDQLGQLDGLLSQATGGKAPTIVLDHIEGVDSGEIITEEQLDNEYHGAVIGDAIIDVSGVGNNDLSHGGGGSVMVDEDADLTITGENGQPGKVTITGSETDPTQSIVSGKGPDGKPNGGNHDIVLDSGSDLTLGKDGAAGGTLNGSITATGKGDGSDVTVNGGHFTITGDVNLADGSDPVNNGNIVIRDQNTTNENAENGLTIGGSVTAGDLEMSGGDTKFDVAGNVDLSGEASLSGNAQASVDGDFSAGGVLDMSGNASLAGEGALESAGIDLTDNAAINRGDTVTTTGDANINGNGGLVAGGDLNVGGAVNIGTGFDINGQETAAGRPNVEVSNGNLTSGQDVTVGQGSLAVSGEAGSADEGNIIIGSVTEPADLVVGNNGDAPKVPATVTADNDLKINHGNADIWDNGNVSIGGLFDVNGSETTGTGSATIEGTLAAGTAEIDENLVIGSATNTSAKPNGSFTTEKDTQIGGDLTVNENGEMTVGASGEGDLDVGGNMTTGKDSSVNVAGDMTVDGNADLQGAILAGGNVDFSQDLILGDNSSLSAGSTKDDHLAVAGNTSIGQNSSVTSAGDMTFGTNPGSKFELGTGSSVTASGAVNFGDSTEFGNPLGGFITSGTGIDFGQGADVVFSGTQAGTNTPHFTGNGTYQDGARFELTTDSNGGNSINGVINIAAGSDTTPGAIFTTDPTWTPSELDKGSASLFVDQTITFEGATSGMVIGSTDASKEKFPGVNLGANSNVHFDFTDFSNAQSVFVGNDGNTLPLVNASNESIELDIEGWGLGKGGTVDLGWNAGDTLDNLGFEISGINGLLQFGVTEDGLLTMTGADASGFEGLKSDLGNVVEAVFEDANGNRNIQNALTEGLTDLYVTVDEDGNKFMSAEGNQFIQDVLTVPVAAGAFNVAYDAMFEFNGSVDRRVLEPRTANSTSFWADVIATTNKAETLFGHSGYSADLYAGVLGTDTTFDNGALLGVAITVGKADADPEGAELSMSNDADYYGISIYGAHNFDKWEVKGDIGYMHVKNDISAGYNLGGTVDTDVFTVGARMGFAAYESDSLKVMPHFGARFANYSMDSLNGTKVKDINVFETPIGVEVSGKFATNGWNVSPRVDMSVVPQFGDKKAKVTNSGAQLKQDVLNDALFTTTLGVSAQKGNVGVGVDYRLGLGNEDRQNHSFIANIRYQF